MYLNISLKDVKTCCLRSCYFFLCMLHLINFMSRPPFTTTVSHILTFVTKMPHILPLWSPWLWGQLRQGCCYTFVGCQSVLQSSACVRGCNPRAWEWHQSWGYRGWVKGEWENFPWKEIKLKRMIKAWFPASWFVFWAEIPFFLFVFAETTITTLPVWLTVTPKNLISGREHTVTIISQINLDEINRKLIFYVMWSAVTWDIKMKFSCLVTIQMFF